MKNSGFTLIELLVVIGIIGILSGMSVAQYKGVVSRARQAKAIAFEAQADRIMKAEMVSDQLEMLAEYDFEEFDANKFEGLAGNGPDLVVSTTLDQRSDDVPYGTGKSFYALNNKRAFGNAGPSSKILNEGTVSFWIKLGSSVQNRWGVVVDNPNGRGLEFLVTQDGNILFRVESATAYTNYLSTNLSVRNSGWHHVLGTYDGELLSLFVDGELIGTKAYVTSLENFGRVITVNHSLDSALYDNLRVYPIAYNPNN